MIVIWKSHLKDKLDHEQALLHLKCLHTNQICLKSDSNLTQSISMYELDLSQYHSNLTQICPKSDSNLSQIWQISYININISGLNFLFKLVVNI